MYKITFEDGSEFDGGTLHNSKWNEIPDKPIKKLEYFLLDRRIILENYEAYNHLIEHITVITTGMSLISKIFIMFQEGINIGIVTIDVIKRKVCFNTAEIGKEYYNKPTTGWKQGVVNKKSSYKLI